MALPESLRGQGYGTKMLNAARRYLKLRLCDVELVGANVDMDPGPFWAKQGFTEQISAGLQIFYVTPEFAKKVKKNASPSLPIELVMEELRKFRERK